MNQSKPISDRLGAGAYRSLRLLETAPDAYVEFRQRQRQWVFSYHHPLLWKVYQTAARLRCIVMGHEPSPIFEEEKFYLPELGRMTTHCVFCGQDIAHD